MHQKKGLHLLSTEVDLLNAHAAKGEVKGLLAVEIKPPPLEGE
ncbi:hypothetical protein [Mesorhizobium escarrei]|uniref:Uncharacterized protein n=1 Tax=Mesorhizobium escarrei TaxID=666018 RepID=A0ABN8JEL7_9HYPH|nr:hypothetical protein [Mesorhizobium escarrei]CAH2395138.1 hypothetical protein MES5069_100001 [Mesorhizobium escarrei]